MTDELIAKLEKRLGRLHARQRLGLEADHEHHIFHRGRHLFHVENWYSIHGLIRGSLKLSGLYWLGRRNATRLRLRENRIRLVGLPAAFDGYRLLHITDMHVDTNPRAMDRLIEIVRGLDYDVCVLTGDYRGLTYGPYEPTIEGMARVARHFKGPVYGVLGNHDSIRMVPALEDMGIRMLLNEAVALTRDDARIHLAGIDDAHYFHADNIEKAAGGIPDDEISILLSHTPEIYRQAAHCDFSVMLCGHTHGGQICLPGEIPLTLDSTMPRYLGRGAWSYHQLVGYTSPGAGTSIVDVRLNCPPEVTLHRLERA
ncbi:MAG TPA: metallophosphoesterase [Alphaproteobacteria bacterium]|nr:metallophosphoesterase [Alphaproteobacteria bacterium]